MRDLYRQLPAVDRLLEAPRLQAFPRPLVVAAARQVLDDVREGIAAGEITELPDVTSAVVQRVRGLSSGRLRPVINATGVVIHTNLGRAPWSERAIRAARDAARYCNLEMDLETGRRGGRMSAIAALVGHLTGAEDAIVVNNCAAAVLLALTAIARDREVIVSRGELVEIGGSFRVPEVIASGGAALVEVGATNRTRVADYEVAVTERTAALLRVHPSNFRVVGFTEKPERTALAALAHAHGVPLLEDLGSGSLDGAFGEESAREAIEQGADLILFSGDKLLGGPQAGVVAGKRDWVQKLRRHPLYRALRVDKVVLAALERTLADHASHRPPPALEMIGRSSTLLERQARELAARFGQRGVPCTVESDEGFVGGGALPGQALPGFVVCVEGSDRQARELRVGDPSVVARVRDGSVRFDPRTVHDDEVPALVDRVASVWGST